MIRCGSRGGILGFAQFVGLTLMYAGCSVEQLPSEESGFVEVTNARLNYVTVGDGQPLIVIPGGPGFGYTYLFEPLRDLLARRLTFYDQRGSGSSSGHESPADLTMDTFVEDLDAIRGALGAETVDLLGHSFGGLLALHYALRHPESVRSLIIVDGDPTTLRDWNHFRQVIATRRTSEEAERLEGIQAQQGWQRRPQAVEEYYRIFLRPYFGDPEFASDLRFGFVDNSFEKLNITSQAVRSDLGEWDLTDTLSSITAPTLLVYGAKSIFEVSAAEAMHAAMPASRLEIMPEVGHFPFIEDAAGFRAVVLEFFR
jgi:proline iminopeptidase